MSYARKRGASRGRGSGVSAGRGRGRSTRSARAAKPARRTIESREDGVRLNKLLADHGLASRRGADALIEEGHVTVDGVQVEELGLRVDPEVQRIEVDGEPLVPAKVERKRYYLLNKPPGVVCTNEKRETRPRAIDLITDRAKGRIYTVGRLDEESKGLVILTNDGEFANRVMHPRYGVSKTYAVKLRGRIGDEELQRVREGVYLSGGRTLPARVVIRKRSREYSHLQVTLNEGKNREIRRMFHAVGFQVVELRRSHIGTLTDRKLKVGYWRFLEADEVAELLALSQEGESGGADSPWGRAGRGRRGAAGRGRRGVGRAARRGRRGAR